MINKIIICICTLLVSLPTIADQTGKGKIIFTQGHIAPNCRTVLHKANDSGVERYFRIADVPGNDDVGGIILSALVANRDVDINYELGKTTGCGSEPSIIFVYVF